MFLDDRVLDQKKCQESIVFSPKMYYILDGMLYLFHKIFKSKR